MTVTHGEFPYESLVLEDVGEEVKKRLQMSSSTSGRMTLLRFQGLETSVCSKLINNIVYIL